MLVREKQFYITFFRLTLIMAAQNLLTFGVNLADNIMLGRYSESTLAAAAMINQIQYLLQMVCMSGIGAGALVVIAQYWGKGETEPIRRIIALTMKFAAGAALLFFCVTFFMPNGVVSIFTGDPAVHVEAVSYLKIMCFTYLFYPFSSVLVAAIRGVKLVVLGTVVSIVSLLINVALNYVLIFGHFGVPSMGITGAAIATLIARAAELIIVLVYIRFFDKRLKLRLLSFIKPDAYYLPDYIKAAFPVILSGFSWGIGMMLQVVILGHMSKSIVAANSIASTVYQIITVFAFGSVSTTSVMMGNMVGSGRLDLVRPYARTFQLLYVFNGIVAGLVLLLLRGFILSIYILEPATWELTKTFLGYLIVIVVFASYQYPSASGIVLGGGNTRYPVIVETAFIWLCVLPLSALSAFVWKFPPVATFLFLKSDQFLKCIPNGIVVNRYRWVRVLTRTDSNAKEAVGDNSE